MRAPFALLAALALFLAAAAVHAKPVRVVFYPATAEFMEQDVLKTTPSPGGKTAVFRLPAMADPATLRLGKGADMVQDVRWDRVPGKEPGDVAELRAQLDALLKKQDALNAEKASLDKVAAFWAEGVEARSLPPARAESLAKAMSRELDGIYTRLPALGRELADLDAAVKTMRRRIDQAAGPWREQWLVTLALPAAAPDSIKVSWSCMIAGCGWRPLYRLAAEPARERIDFTFSAEIFQSTGRDLVGTDIALATVRPSMRLIPPELPQWIIRPRPEREPAPRRAMEAMVMKAGAPEPNALMADAAPEPEVKSSYTLWNLGPKTVPAGQTIAVPIQAQTWPASFTWLIRPAVDPVSYLQAKITLDKPRDLPPGPALHMLDGAMMGKSRFSLSGTEADISFGRDFTVTATETLKARKSGSEGFLSSKQTCFWSYDIEAKNTKTYPIPARIEEPQPQSRSEKITLEFTSSPKAETNHHTLAWNATLPPKSKAAFTLEINLAAPEDMPLDLGWR